MTRNVKIKFAMVQRGEEIGKKVNFEGVIMGGEEEEEEGARKRMDAPKKCEYVYIWI